MSELDHDTWARIFPYLEKAQDMAPDELKSWLDRLSIEHPDICGPLRAVIAESQNMDEDFLARPFVFPKDESSRTGQPVGAYTIESLLGRGGMGEVWLAQRSDGHFNGLFAIKFLGVNSVRRRFRAV